MYPIAPDSISDEMTRTNEITQILYIVLKIKCTYATWTVTDMSLSCAWDVSCPSNLFSKIIYIVLYLPNCLPWGLGLYIYHDYVYIYTYVAVQSPTFSVITTKMPSQLPMNTHFSRRHKATCFQV